MTCPVDVLIHHMRGVASSDVKWEAKFARSVLKQAKRPKWKPSAKQTAIMERMVGDLFNENECEVLEDFDTSGKEVH